MPRSVKPSESKQVLARLYGRVRDMLPAQCRDWVTASETAEGIWTLDVDEPSGRYGSMRIQFWNGPEYTCERKSWSINVPNWIFRKVQSPVSVEELDVDPDYTDFYAGELSMEQLLGYFAKCVQEYLE